MVSQAQHLAWMRDHYPELWERMKVRIAEGRLEPTGSMWVEADCNIPSGESLVRQIVYGKRFYLEEFGIETNDVWLPDVFGYSAALPQIMRRSGIRWFLTQKLSWNQYNVLPHHSFLWEGIDGSRVFTHFPPADTYSGNVSVRELRFGVENFKDHDRATRSLYLFGWGDGGGGPTSEMLESARRLADIDGLPRLDHGGPAPFFTEAEAEIRRPGGLGRRALSRAPPRHLHQPGRHQARQPSRPSSPCATSSCGARWLPGPHYPAERARGARGSSCCSTSSTTSSRDRGSTGSTTTRARDHAHILSEAERADRRRAGPATSTAIDTTGHRRTRSSCSTRSPTPAPSWSRVEAPGEVDGGRRRRRGRRTGPARRRGPGRLRSHRARLRLPGLRPRGRRWPPADRPRHGRSTGPSRTSTCASSSTTRACCPRSSTSRRSARSWPRAPGATASSSTPTTPTSSTPGTSTGSPSTRWSTSTRSSRSTLVEHGPLRAGIRVDPPVRRLRI